MNWIEIKAEFADAPEDWSPIVDLLVRHGCPNTLLEDDPPRITACVVETEGSPARVAAIELALKQIGATVVLSGYVPDKNWAEIWKAHFKPRRVGARFLIRPTWEHAEGDLTIVLDPGQAFGTGDHPTTRMCLELMESTPIEGVRVMDLGCGSGVLSIGASLLKAREIVAIDIDRQSVEVAEANFALNGVRASCRVGDRPEGENWDVVVSNIISATLILLARDVRNAIKLGGTWIVSGIIEANWPDVLSAAESAGFRLEVRLVEDGWVAATFVG